MEFKENHCMFLCLQSACLCLPGYSGDGKTCSPINLCKKVKKKLYIHIHMNPIFIMHLLYVSHDKLRSCTINLQWLVLYHTYCFIIPGISNMFSSTNYNVFIRIILCFIYIVCIIYMWHLRVFTWCFQRNGGCYLFAKCTMTGPGERNCTCAQDHIGDGINCKSKLPQVSTVDLSDCPICIDYFISGT